MWDILEGFGNFIILKINEKFGVYGVCYIYL